MIRFDHEKLDVYRLELEFIAWVTPSLDEVSASGKPRTREVSDQLDRAGHSALLNTAEGNGKRQRPVRAKFFDDARGSATECAACLDAIVAKGVSPVSRIEAGKEMLVRIVSMLSKLADRHSPPEPLHEEAVEYLAGETQPEQERRVVVRGRARGRRRERFYGTKQN